MYVNTMIKKKYNKLAQKGFTIIEIVIAVGLFTVIMVIGVGAVLKVNQTHKKTQDTREVIDNMHFVIEDMSRNIRLGSKYNCKASEGGLGTPQDCPFTETSSPFLSFAFEKVLGDPFDDGDQVIYRIVEIPGTGQYRIMKGVGVECATSSDGDGCATLTPASVRIDPNRSGFNVRNAANPDLLLGDGLEPFVLIRLAGDIIYKDITTPFSLQTTISQRQIDL